MFADINVLKAAFKHKIGWNYLGFSNFNKNSILFSSSLQAPKKIFHPNIFGNFTFEPSGDFKITPLLTFIFDEIES